MGLGCKKTNNIRHNNNDSNREVVYQNTGKEGRQYEILHNVDCNFTQYVTYTVLIRDQQ